VKAAVCRDAGMPGCRDAGMPGCRDAGMPGCGDAAGRCYSDKIFVMTGEHLSNITCVECNAEVPESSENCPECGFPFDSLTPAACQQCGKLVVFSSDLCPECGFPNETLQRGRAVAAGENPGADTISDDTISDGPASDNAPKAQTEGAVAGPSGQEVPVPAADTEPPELQPPNPDLDPASAESDLSDIDYIVNSIIRYIAEVKVDIVNKPIKAFLQILTELDNSNKQLQTTLAEQSQQTLSGVQETALSIVDEISKMSIQQNKESLGKSQELALTIVSEIAALKEASKAAAAESSKQAPAPTASVIQENKAAPNDNIEYILYLCIMMAVFTLLNFFITIYAVKLIK